MRKREIKPGFFTDDELVELPPLTRLLFIGLWCMADREGKFEINTKKIKMNILPCDNLDIDEALQSLMDCGLLTRYEAGGKQCAYIRNFAKHQNIHPSEKGSHLPAPPGWAAAAIHSLRGI